jgi:hypothetical protein
MVPPVGMSNRAAINNAEKTDQTLMPNAAIILNGNMWNHVYTIINLLAVNINGEASVPFPQLSPQNLSERVNLDYFQCSHSNFHTKITFIALK